MQVDAMNNFRVNLRAAMERRNLSQRAVAERMGVTHPFINRVLVGKADPTIPFAEKIADAVGCELSDLISPSREFQIRDTAVPA